MADIVSPATYTKLTDTEITFGAPVTTSLMTKFGENINKLIDDITPNFDFTSSFKNYVALSGTYTSTYDSTNNLTVVTLPSITYIKSTMGIIYVQAASVLSWHSYSKTLVRNIVTSGGTTSENIDIGFHTSSTTVSSTQKSFPFATTQTASLILLHFDLFPIVSDYLNTFYTITWGGNLPSNMTINGYVFEL